MNQYTKSIRGKLFHYFQQRLHLKQSTRGWYRADCIFCSRSSALGINVSERKVHCFGCLEKMSPIELVMELEGFKEMREVYNFLKIQQDYEGYSDYTIKPIEIKQVNLPDSYRLITDVSGSYLGKCAQGYMKGRGFSLKKLEQAGIGYCTRGEYAGYIIFPCYLRGNLVFYQGRKYIDIGPKMRNPELERFGIGKTQVIYNGDALFIYNNINVVESITNCLTLGQSTIGIFGKTLSPWQLSFLINSPCKSLCFLLDDDAYIHALEMAMQFVHYKKVKVIKMPLGIDVNQMGKRDTVKIKNSTPWQSYNDLLKLRNDEKGPINTHNRESVGRTPTRGF